MQTYEEFRYVALAFVREGWRMLQQELTPLELTPPRAEVLRVLGESGPLTLKRLGELLVCETGSPSRLVHALVELDLVERTPDPEDRRSVRLCLTSAGKKANRAVIDIERKFDEQLSDHLSERTARTFNKALRAFIRETASGHALDERTRD